MQISIDSIGPDGLAVDQALTVPWLNDLLAGPSNVHAALRPGKLQAQLSRSGDAVTLRGTLQVALQGPCSRCLTEVSLALQAPLQLTFVPANQAPQAGEDGELADEDLGVEVYEGRQIDLGPLVRDEMLLQLPMQPLCDGDCRGLCPSCGSNRNHAACRCNDPVDLRLQSLQDIVL